MLNFIVILRSTTFYSYSAHRSPTAESITTRNEPRAIGQDDETGRLVKGAKAFGGPKGRTGSIMS
ncbi:hypothetical protein CK203_059069 [Vitis vinifera]|uniref:Uncharacterized protein n=1 Tax=Vitis vinifera TaxID=29760 RepID=A0A438GTR1_VITVI|nr:hypothetical protein CK203_059069 [Vitis vinifera]